MTAGSPRRASLALKVVARETVSRADLRSALKLVHAVGVAFPVQVGRWFSAAIPMQVQDDVTGCESELAAVAGTRIRCSAIRDRRLLRSLEDAPLGRGRATGFGTRAEPLPAGCGREPAPTAAPPWPCRGERRPAPSARRGVGSTAPAGVAAVHCRRGSASAYR